MNTDIPTVFTAPPQITTTGEADDDIFTAGAAHGLVNGDPVRLAVLAPAAGTGFTLGATYYVRDVVALTFKVAATIGGNAVNVLVDVTDAKWERRVQIGDLADYFTREDAAELVRYYYEVNGTLPVAQTALDSSVLTGFWGERRLPV